MYFLFRINIFAFSSLIFLAASKELTPRYFWNVIDYQFDTSRSRQEAIATKQYIPENCVPTGIEIWKDKVFVSIPRYKPGVPSTLNYINLNTSEKSPLLIPYPSWRDNDLQSGTLRSLHRLNIDQCERLWSVDDSPESNISPYPMLIIINLNTNSIQKYNLTKDTVHDSSFTNLVVDVDPTNCNNAFAYIADSRGAGLVIYNLKDNTSRRISHPYFSYDPLSTIFHVNDVKYHLPLGIIGLTLSNNRPNGYKDLFFHPGASNNIFYISTEVLRNTTSLDNHEAFKVLGNKGNDLQSYTSYFHLKTKVLFYNIINKNAIGCWNSKKFAREFSDATNGIVIRNDTSLVFIIDLRGYGDDDYLWFMSNKMPLLAKKGFNKEEINFRIFSVDVKTFINGTVCDENRRKDEQPVFTTTYY